MLPKNSSLPWCFQKTGTNYNTTANYGPVNFYFFHSFIKRLSVLLRTLYVTMKRLSSIFKYVFFFGIGVFLVWWQFHKMTPDEFRIFRNAIANAHYWLVFPVIVIALTSHLSRAMRWKILIEPLGYKPSLFNVFSSLMAGYVVNTFVTRVGEVVKCTLLGKYEKIPTEKLIGTILVERIFDILCYFVFIAITILVQFQLVLDFLRSDDLAGIAKKNNGHAFLIKIVVIVLVITAVVIIIRRLQKKHINNPVMVRFKSFMAGIKEGIATVKKMKGRRWFLFHTCLIWSMYLLQIYVGFLAINELSHLGISAACSVLTLATIAMIIMPGGLGAFPTVVSLILVLYNVDKTIGYAFGFVMWGATTFITIFFGLLFTCLMIYRNKKNNTLPATAL
jgi:glycosyltransferase 2 family protein